MSKKKIILNTSFTYLRSLLAAAVGLFTARWVLNALGADDYGLYGLVGSVLVFITFLNGVLAGAVSRYFAYTIGKKDEEELNKWFNASIIIHIVVPTILIILGLSVGTFAIHHWFNIIPEKKSLATIVFFISVISAGITMMMAPFKGLLLAKQDIRIQSIIEMLQSVAHLILMYILTLLQSSHLLIIYALMMASETIVFNSITSFVAMRKYEEIHFTIYKWNDISKYVKEILLFSTWKSLAGFGNICFNQGQAIVLNLFFGTRMNASYSIASNLSAQSSSISNSMMMAITPEITSREGSGSHDAMKHLSLKACKYSVWLMAIIALPLFLEVDNLLVLWLNTPPEFANILCQYILISMVVDKMTIGLESAINACGRIKAFQISCGLNFIASVFVTYLLLAIWDDPAMIGLSIIISQLINMTIRLHFANKVAEVSYSSWFKTVLFPVSSIIILNGILSKFFKSIISIDGFTGLVITTLITTLFFIILGWFFIIDDSLKISIQSKLKR